MKLNNNDVRIVEKPLWMYFHFQVLFIDHFQDLDFRLRVISIVMYNITITNTIDDATKKVKNAEQDARAKAQTAEDHAEGKPSSETLNKAKEKVKDAFS